MRAVSFRLPLAGNTCVAVRYRSSTGSWKSACVFQADATLDKPCCLVVSARQWTVRLTAERSRTRSSAINRGSSAGTFRRFPQASISSSAYDSHCRIRAVTRKSTTSFRLEYGSDVLRGFKCQVRSSPPKHPEDLPTASGSTILWWAGTSAALLR